MCGNSCRGDFPLKDLQVLCKVQSSGQGGRREQTGLAKKKCLGGLAQVNAGHYSLSDFGDVQQLDSSREH